MKAILKFNLPEDEESFKHAQKGDAYAAALWDFSEYLRRRFKHEDPKPNQEEFYEEIMNHFNEDFEGLFE